MSAERNPQVKTDNQIPDKIPIANTPNFSGARIGNSFMFPRPERNPKEALHLEAIAKHLS
jgi:hypothetical protein